MRTAKITLAAVVAYVIADHLHTSSQPVLAPLTSLLVVQLTMYETVEHGLERVLSVVAGVLVAVGVGTFVGLTWWSLGAIIAVALVVGELVRLGPHLLEVPITAMLILAVHAARTAALGRVSETLIGAAVGIVVNAVIAPPLYVQPASQAIGELADRMADYLRALAEQLRAEWSRDASEHWLAEARALGREMQRADEQLGRAEQSARLNPRGGRARAAQPRLRTALTGLEHCYVSVRHLARALYDHTLTVGEEAEAYGPPAREALAQILDSAADALGGVVTVACGGEHLDEARRRVEQDLARMHQLRHRLSELLLVDPRTDQGAWQQHGALLAAIDRIRVEVEAAVRPPRAPWRSPLGVERQRQAARLVIDAASQAAGELRPILPTPRLASAVRADNGHQRYRFVRRVVDRLPRLRLGNGRGGGADRHAAADATQSGRGAAGADVPEGDRGVAGADATQSGRGAAGADVPEGDRDVAGADTTQSGRGAAGADVAESDPGGSGGG